MGHTGLVMDPIGRLRSLRPVRFLEVFITRWQNDRCGGLAAEIAFFALLSVFPTLLVLTALLGSFQSLLGANAADDIENWVAERALDVFGADTGVADVVADLFADTSGQALTVGALAALYTSSRGFASVVKALDVAYDQPTRRGWVGARMIGLLLALGTVLVGAITVMLLVVGPLVGGGDDVAESVGGGGGSFLRVLWDWFRWPVVVAILIAWAATIYNVAPNHRAPWKWELPGAVVATFLWAASAFGFQWVLRFAAEGTNAVFGVLGTAITLLVWFYILALGLMAGAEINAMLADKYNIGEQRWTPTPVRSAYKWWQDRTTEMPIIDPNIPLEEVPADPGYTGSGDNLRP